MVAIIGGLLITSGLVSAGGCTTYPDGGQDCGGADNSGAEKTTLPSDDSFNTNGHRNPNGTEKSTSVGTKVSPGETRALKQKHMRLFKANLLDWNEKVAVIESARCEGNTLEEALTLIVDDNESNERLFKLIFDRAICK